MARPSRAGSNAKASPPRAAAQPESRARAETTGGSLAGLCAPGSPAMPSSGICARWIATGLSTWLSGARHEPAPPPPAQPPHLRRSCPRLRSRGRHARPPRRGLDPQHPGPARLFQPPRRDLVRHPRRPGRLDRPVGADLRPLPAESGPRPARPPRRQAPPRHPGLAGGGGRLRRAHHGLQTRLPQDGRASGRQPRAHADDRQSDRDAGGPLVITTPKIGTLSQAILSGVAHEGFTVTSRDGRHARLAVIDEDGNVIEDGPEVAREAWNVAVASYRNFLRGRGYLRVRSEPPCGVTTIY